MKRHLIVVAAVAAVLLTGGGVAVAQTTGPDTRACTDAKAAVEEALTARDAAKIPSQQEQDVTNAQNALDELPRTGTGPNNEPLGALVFSQAEINRLQAIPADNSNHALAQAKLAVIVPVVEAQAKLKTEKDELAGLQKALAEKERLLDEAEADRDKACAVPATTTPPPPPPVDPGDVFDCEDFPLEDGTPAQQVFDQDRSDPHNLDADDDNRACEVGEDDRQIPVVPDSAPDTGGGPA